MGPLLEIKRLERFMTTNGFLKEIAAIREGKLSEFLQVLSEMPTSMIQSFRETQSVRPELSEEDSKQLDAILDEALKLAN